MVSSTDLSSSVIFPSAFTQYANAAPHATHPVASACARCMSPHARAAPPGVATTLHRAAAPAVYCATEDEATRVLVYIHRWQHGHPH
jgi:hypothetical protein